MNRFLLLVSCLALTCLCSCIGHRAAKKGFPQQSRNVDLGYTQENAHAFTGSAKTVKVKRNAVDLTDYLRQVSGLTIMGQGANASVRIRGVANSIHLTSTPLFVLDGMRMGHQLADVYNSVHIQDIDQVTVLKDASSTSLYGAAGANGVILIKTRK